MTEGCLQWNRFLWLKRFPPPAEIESGTFSSALNPLIFGAPYTLLRCNRVKIILIVILIHFIKGPGCVCGGGGVGVGGLFEEKSDVDLLVSCYKYSF